MQVDQVAFDRFVLELPTPDRERRALSDRDIVEEAAAWLWAFGPTPLIAVVGFAAEPPRWLGDWSSRPVGWAPDGMRYGRAVLINSRLELQRLLGDGTPHDRTALLWPRRSEAKTFEALNGGGKDWLGAVYAHARVTRDGEVFEVNQVPTG